MTSPSAVASTGTPDGASMSTPACHSGLPPYGDRRQPNGEVTAPRTGHPLGMNRVDPRVTLAWADRTGGRARVESAPAERPTSVMPVRSVDSRQRRATREFPQTVGMLDPPPSMDLSRHGGSPAEKSDARMRCGYALSVSPWLQTT